MEKKTKTGGSEDRERVKRFLRDQEGATAVEYAIMPAAIAGVITAIVFALGGKVEGLINSADSEPGNAASS